MQAIQLETRAERTGAGNGTIEKEHLFSTESNPNGALAGSERAHRERNIGDVQFKWMLVTPRDAEIILANHENYRNRSTRREQEYAEMMNDNEWRIGPPLMFSEDGTLIDGQTRLAAVILHGKPVAFFAILGLPEEVKLVIDTGRARTGADVLRYECDAANTIRLRALITAIHTGTTPNKRIYNHEYPHLKAKYQEGIDFAFRVFPSPIRCVTIAPVQGAFVRAWLCHTGNEWRDSVEVAAKALAECDFSQKHLSGIKRLYMFLQTTKISSMAARRDAYLRTCRAIMAVINNEELSLLKPASNDPFTI